MYKEQSISHVSVRFYLNTEHYGSVRKLRDGSPVSLEHVTVAFLIPARSKVVHNSRLNPLRDYGYAETAGGSLLR